MSDMKNIYDVLDEIGFENQCEKYVLGFHRDTDTPTMTKFRQESMKEFCFSLIQQYAEKVYEDFIRTRKALDVAKERLKNTILDAEVLATPEYLASRAKETLDEITALEQKDAKMNLVREIKQYQETDGTCFGTRVEAEEYEEMLQNPHFKKLQERIEKLEADLSALRIEVSTKTWFRDAVINRPPYQQPMTYMAYNPATGQPEQKDVK